MKQKQLTIKNNPLMRALAAALVILTVMTFAVGDFSQNGKYMIALLTVSASILWLGGFFKKPFTKEEASSINE